MSLQYIIDGYNIINHPIFSRIHKHIESPPYGLARFIKTKRLTGSPNNKLTLIFDGYPPSGNPGFNDKTAAVIFSRKISADEKIKRMVEESASRKNIIVVSDDKEIKFFVSSCGAKSMSVEEFIRGKEKLKHREERQDLLKVEITYSQMQKINKELGKIWLVNDK